MGLPEVLRLVAAASIGCGIFLLGYFYGGIRVAPQSLVSAQQVVQAVPRPSALDTVVRSSDLDQFERLANEAAAWATADGLTQKASRERVRALEEFGRLRDLVLEQVRAGLPGNQALEVLDFVQEGTHIAQTRLEAVLAIVGGRGAARHSAPLPLAEGSQTAAIAQGGPSGSDAGNGGGDAAAVATASGTIGKSGLVVVQVDERPVGIHVEPGSTTILEVFPGFPAHRLGLEPGCRVLAVAGAPVAAGTWVEAFQKVDLPFELQLNCSRTAAEEGAGQGPLTLDPRRYRVFVVKKPFGMNIQVNVVPRVVEVLPGFPAEAAGVRTGFVLTEVGGEPVTGHTWFEQFQNAELPFTLTFDTTVPLHEGNPFLRVGENGTFVELEEEAAEPKEALPVSLFQDVRCEVAAVPFGMQVRSRSGELPVVDEVVARSPAEAAGVRPGDVLIEVAGLPVTSGTWFSTFQQAMPPFGLRLKRRRTEPAQP